MLSRNKITKPIKKEIMKKTILVSTIVLSVVSIAGIAPAQANSQGAVAIIDVNFESQLIGGQVTEVCLASSSVCNSVPRLRIESDFRAFNHGTAMADVARANNPGAHLVLIEAGTSKTGVITGVELASALSWVISNAKALNIRAVSFSYNAGNGTTCTPASEPRLRSQVHANIVTAISTLKSSGIRFYASSGNHGSTSRVDYPACISDTISVGSTDFVGSAQLSDLVLSGSVYTSSRLKSVRTALQGRHDSFAITLTDPNPFMVGFTTSVATAVAAATNR